MSYLTDAEKLRLTLEAPDPYGTIGYANVSHTQLSIAKYYGGITVHGQRYTYFPATDELWRDDVLKMVHGWRRTDAMAKELPTQVQGELL